MKKEINVTKIKCIISTVIVLCMCLTMIPMVSTNVDAASNIVINGVDIGYSHNSYFTKNGSTCKDYNNYDEYKNATPSCHNRAGYDCVNSTDPSCNCMRYWPTGDATSCVVDLKATQCMGYVEYCQWKVYGVYDLNNPKSFVDISGDIYESDCTGSILKQKLINCAPATHIRTFGSKKGWRHSIAIISTSDYGVEFTDCNSDGGCIVRKVSMSWDELAAYVKSYGGIDYANSCQSNISHNPLGYIDGYAGGTHSLYIGGWAFDADDTNAQLEIHVYSGETFCGALTANILRSDINGTYGCGDYHGFEGTINLDKSIVGSQTFSIWAVGVGGGVNTHLGYITVNIDSDTVGPILYHVNISNIGPTGYTVSVVPSDSNGISKVKFPTWTEYNGQDDLISDWSTNSLADGTKSGDTYTYRVKVAEHNGEYGIYYTHIYAWDGYGNETSYQVFVNLQQPDYTEVSKEFGDDFYAYIENAGAGTVLTHEPTGFGNGDYDTIFTAYTKSDAQIWHFTRNEDNSYQISPKSDESLALHVVAGNGACGTSVILHTANKSSAQRWFISKVDGQYFFRPACSDDCYLDLPDASLNNGVSARIWDYNGSTAQQINLGDPYAEEIVAEGVYNGYVYRIYDKNMTWTEAQTFCEQNGGNLASITSQDEQNFIADLINGKGNMNQYWIGARYLDGNYVWSDGTEWSYTNWDNSEPNGIRDGQIFEGFVHMYNAVNPKVEGTARFKWNDISNGNSLETEEMFFGLHHVGFVYKAKAKCDVCSWDDGVVTASPTATTNGVKTYTCIICFETKTEPIPATGIPEVDENAPQLIISNKTVTAGQTFTVELTAENLPAVKSLMIDNFSYDGNKLEFVSAELNLKNALIADWDSTEMIATVTFADNADINGVVMTLTFKAKENIEGECPISCDIYATQIQTNGSETQVDVSVVAGTITIVSYSRGDVNGDKYLNSNDAIYLLRNILSPSRYPINQDGDMNGDGYVNSNDAIYLLRHILSPSRYPLHE